MVIFKQKMPISRALPAIDVLAGDVCANLVISAGLDTWSYFSAAAMQKGGAADEFHRWPLVTGFRSTNV
jgi:hypothetical protein